MGEDVAHRRGGEGIGEGEGSREVKVLGASSSLDLAVPHSWSGGVWTRKQVRQGGKVISRERREVEGQADVATRQLVEGEK
jgi:hypothetical protein